LTINGFFTLFESCSSLSFFFLSRVSSIIKPMSRAPATIQAADHAPPLDQWSSPLFSPLQELNLVPASFSSFFQPLSLLLQPVLAPQPTPPKLPKPVYLYSGIWS